jgi:hypothetical protein
MLRRHITRRFRAERPEPVMSTTEMHAELERCTAEIAGVRRRLDPDSTLRATEQWQELLAISRRLDAIRARLDAVDGTGNSDQDAVEGGQPPRIQFAEIDPADQPIARRCLAKLQEINATLREARHG